MSSANQREHFRVSYVGKNRPIFTVGANKFNVADISEQGMRFEIGNIVNIKVGTHVAGVIVFTDGSRVSIEGHVHRFSKDGLCAILQLTVGIPLTKMMDESRRQLKMQAQVKRT